ncbi:MAG: hypothetical protein PHX04_04810 [Bacilli bacterium]|nr:hypothetical protein [Bacilli bacterium]
MEIFINKAIQNGITNYLNFINNKQINKVNLFEFYVVKILVQIYGEINIINPFKLGKEKSFIINLQIFGIKEDQANLFIKYMEEYDIWLNSSTSFPKNDITIKISKLLINMIMTKSINHPINIEDIEVFDSFFNPTNKELIIINELTNKDQFLISKLWKRKKSQFNKGLIFEEILPNLLSIDIYIKYGLSINEVKQLSNLKIEEINDKITSEETNDSEGGIAKFDPKKLILTSGSGFVDTMVLLSIIVTEIMIGLLIAFWFLRR